MPVKVYQLYIADISKIYSATGMWHQSSNQLMAVNHEVHQWCMYITMWYWNFGLAFALTPNTNENCQKKICSGAPNLIIMGHNNYMWRQPSNHTVQNEGVTYTTSI